MKETEEKYLFQIIKLKDDIIERSEAIIKLNADIRLSSERQHKYEENIRVYMQSGTSTIMRSFLELYLKTFETRTWQSASILHAYITGLQEYYILDMNVTDAEL